MNIAYTHEDFLAAKGTDKLTLKCENCKETFFKKKRYIVQRLKGKKHDNCLFCSRKCARVYTAKNQRVNLKCDVCEKEFTRVASHTKANTISGKVFCSSSCAAKYNNIHKTKGYRRSKLEVALEERLRARFQNIRLYCNDRNAISSELDFYWPDLRFAVELNGPLHYEPIYGPDRLVKVQDNDRQKMARCREAGIELAVLDVSSVKYFKPSVVDRYFVLIESLVVPLLGRAE